MIRIGILGSDNSHALAFAQLVNIPDAQGRYAYPDTRITHIYGLDAAQTAQVAEQGRIEHVCAKSNDMLGQVDAVMVVFRHGALHLGYALPYLKAGVAVWVDKPFTQDPREARELAHVARIGGAILQGGSTCKYVPAIDHIRAALANGAGEKGKLIQATLGFAAQLENEYGGLCFYGSHLAEIALAAFGYHPRSLTATRNGGAITAVLNYDAVQVTLNFDPLCHEYYYALFYEKGLESAPLDISDSYARGFAVFHEALLTGRKSLPDEMVIMPVELVQAVLDSARSGREITFAD